MVSTQESELFGLTESYLGRPLCKTNGSYFLPKVCSSPFRGKICQVKIVFCNSSR